MRRAADPLLLAAFSVPFVSMPGIACGQAVRVSTTTLAEGWMVEGHRSLDVPVPGDDPRAVMWVSGALVRIDRGRFSTIEDLRTGDGLHVDHVARTFSRVNLRVMRDVLTGAHRMSREAVSTERTDPGGGPPPAASERILQVVPVRLASDSTLLIVETWVGGTAPAQARLAELNERTSAVVRSVIRMSAVFGLDEATRQLAMALGATQAALPEGSGAILRSRVTMVIVPPGVEFDLEATIAGDTVRELDVYRALVEPPDRPMVTLRVTREATWTEETVLDRSLFQPPEGYVETPWPRGPHP